MSTSAAEREAAPARKAARTEDYTARLAEFEKANPQLALPTVRFGFEALDEDDRLVSKAGGWPFWPASEPWDEETMGKHRLVIQINFSEVPSAAKLGLPIDGIFQLFWSDYEEASNASDNNAQGPETFVCRYWNSAEVEVAKDDLLPTDELPDLDDDHDMMGLDPAKPHRLTFSAFELSHVDNTDYRFDDALKAWLEATGSQDVRTEAESIRSAKWESKTSSCQLGGGSTFYNGDWRTASTPPEQPTVLLLQLASDVDLPIMLGDCGMDTFWISAGDLAKRDFSRITYLHDE